MRQLLFLGVVWTGVVLAVLLFWPAGVQTPSCMKQISRSADCLAQVAVANDRLWWTQTLPMLVFFASGYVVVGALALRRLRSPRH
jgi:prepilin signal peptidase PulO-like enzyme (type II secretory pathway)